MGSLAKPILTIAGTVLGAYVGMPGLGAGLGSAVGAGAGALAGSAIGGALGPKPQTPQAPQIEPVPIMPTTNDATVRAAKRRASEAQAQRQGRMSTILSDTTNDPLGG